MSQSTTTAATVYVGLDVHKDSIDIALAEAGRDGEVRHLGAVAGGVVAVSKALRRATGTSSKPTANGTRQPQLCNCSGVSNAIITIPNTPATKVAMPWLADCQLAYSPRWVGRGGLDQERASRAHLAAEGQALDQAAKDDDHGRRHADGSV